MKSLLITVLSGAMLIQSAFADESDGYIKKQSAHSVSVTLDRLEGILNEKGLTVFARIDHAEGAMKAGMEIPAEQLLLFGNPKMGTPLMMTNPVAGIDLPMKALAYEDADGAVWLVYADPASISERHSLSEKAEIITKMTGALDNFTNAAIAE